jgi:polyisoprenyl-teichoic acid--peptidoglycan teichoic acid transferase
MYKFSSDKQPKGRAIDGILSSGPRQPKRDPIMRGSQQRLGDFKRADGFRGQTVPRISASGRLQAPQTATSGKKVRPQAGLGAQPRNSKATSAGVQRGGRQSSKKRNMWKIFARTSIGVVLVVMLITGFIFGKAWWNANKVFKGGAEGAVALNKDVDPSMLKGEGDGRVNILLLGRGGEGHEGADLTDSIMIASIDPINNETALLSIPRDLWVKPSGLWAMKINAVYSSAKTQSLSDNPKDKAAAEKAGVAAIEKTVENYMGVPVHYYVMVDFTAFKQAVDAVGGISVNVKEDLVDYNVAWENKGSPVIARKGTVNMDGKKALLYARSRYGSARGDFDRADRQREVIVAIKNKVLSVGTFANPVKVTQLLDTFGSRVSTNLSVNEMMRIYEISKLIDSSKITSTSLANPDKPLVVTDNIGGQSVVRPKAGINNFTEIRAFVRTELKDGYIKNENASIIVLNASGRTGAASARANELKGYGYNVIQVADAGTPGIYGTQLVDQTKGIKKYTKRYLEQRLNTSAKSSVEGMDLSPYIADFIIVIGQ